MAINQPYSGSLTVSTTELSLVSGTSTLQSNTNAGVYQVMLDLSALATGDEFELRIKEKVTSTGTQRAIQSVKFGGAPADPNYVSASMILLNGWDITLQKLFGTDRAIPYSIRQVA